MKTGSVSRVLKAGKFVRYLMGWAAGVETETGHRFELEERQQGGEYHSKVFSSPKAAEKAIASEQDILGQKGRRYIRAYAYETPNPENAKGMPLLNTVENTFWFLD